MTFYKIFRTYEDADGHIVRTSLYFGPGMLRYRRAHRAQPCPGRPPLAAFLRLSDALNFLKYYNRFTRFSAGELWCGEGTAYSGEQPWYVTECPTGTFFIKEFTPERQIL